MKKPLWLLLSDLSRPDIALVLPSLAWMARDAGAELECYLEAQRDGRLFARTGSTVLGGGHHLSFNYLCAAFEVKFLLLGPTQLFDSSLGVFGNEVLARAETAAQLYQDVLAKTRIAPPQTVLFGPVEPLQSGEAKLEIAPYLFPEIWGRRALAFGSGESEDAARIWGKLPAGALFLDEAQTDRVRADFPELETVDVLQNGDSYASITRRIAARWKAQAKGVAFGDPPAILSQIPAHCRASRVALFGERQNLHPSQVEVAAYVEQTSEAAIDVAQLVQELKNPVIVGRQTGDGDIFEWSKSGACIQIIDPNRPAFPVVETLAHPWSAQGDFLADEPDDETLRTYAREGKILASLLWHSGEVAHNEAMLNLFELCAFTGIKMGIGVHAQRYETSPQTWEMLAIDREKGGVRGLIEPVLHSGGLGVLAETNCPPPLLQKHCAQALKRIRDVAGPSGVPRGYYAFMDSDLATLTHVKRGVFEATQGAGLEYFVSSAQPGRNRVWSGASDFVALNQSARVVCPASPFVRITTAEDVQEYAAKTRPGWFLGTLDAPVISFNPYIWRHGARFMQMVEKITGGGFVNVLPHTVARYARILRDEGFLPPEA